VGAQLEYPGHVFLPRRAGLLGLLKKTAYHIRRPKFSQRLATRAEFNIIVRRGSGRTQKPIRTLPHEVRDGLARFAVEVFKDAGFVAYHPIEIIGAKMVQSFVVRYHDAVAVVQSVAAVNDFNSDLLTLSYGLESNRKRRKNQNPSIRFTADVFRLCQLNEGLAEAAIREYGGATLATGPFHKCNLKREQLAWYPYRIKAVV
jgi:hypothetical protein